MYSKDVTTTIYVGGGSFSNPPYKFYLDENGDQELTNLTLDPSQSYLFKRLNNATSHPFYISDIGYNQASSSKISLSGDGSPTSGIKGNESLLLSFNEGATTDLSQLYFFCTSHSSMISSFNVENLSGEINILNSIPQSNPEIDWNNEIDWGNINYSSQSQG